MIAKRIQRKKQKATDKGLFAYVVNEKNKGRGDPTTWALAEYIADTPHDGEKVESVRITNCVSSDVGWAVKEILATQAKNTRSKADKSYHLVISFPEGEKPTPDQMRDIEDQAVRAVGLQDHQRISAVHINTDHYHLHVAISKVHPTTFRNVEPWYDHYRLQEVCVQLEIKHGLTRDNHSQTPEQVSAKVGEMEAHAGKQSFVSWAKETAAEAIVEVAREGRSWDDMHAALAQFDIEVRQRGAGLVIVHRQDSRWRVKASDVAREVAFKALTDRWGPYKPPTLPAAAEIGAPGEGGPDRGGGASVTTPAQALPDEGHDEADAHQEPVDRETFVPPTSPQSPGPAPYVPGPVHQGPAVPGLWARYQEERREADRHRTAAMNELRAGHIAYGEQLTAYYKRRMAAVKTAGLSKVNRMDSYRYIREAQRADFVERVERERRERNYVRSDFPVISWLGFLEREAAAGDIDALGLLRSQASKRLSVLEQIIEAGDYRAARDVIHRHMKPSVGRRGDVFYRIDDGGAVVDSVKHVSVTTISTGAILLALELAMQRFGAGELIVRGTSEFEQRVIQVGKDYGIVVSARKPVANAPAGVHTLSVRTNKDIADHERNDNHRGI